MHDAIKNALMLAKNRRKYQTGGVPDDSSQEAFLHEQLQGSAPQYDPQGGLETAKSATQSLAGMTTPGALADAAGYMGGPSALQNLRDQNYLDAALQLAAVVPGVGPLSKAAKIAKEGKAAAEAEEAILKGFRTAKGSVYEVTPEGYTIRNKAPRPEHPGSHGLQPPSKRTVYVPEKELQKLAEFQAQSPHQRGLMYHNETNRLGIMYGSGPEAGTIPERTIVSFSTTPAVGLTPIEDFGQSRVHFGNPITELYHSGSWPPANNPKYSIETASPDLRTNRRYTTVEQAAKSRPRGAKLVHTMIEDAPVIPPPTKRAEGGQIDEFDDEETINQENPEDINTEEEAENAILHKNQRKSDNLKPIIDRGLVVKRKISVKKGQKPTTTIPKPVKYVPQAKENAEFRKLMAEVDELLEKFKD